MAVLQFRVALALHYLTITASANAVADVSMAVPHVTNSPLDLFALTSPSILRTNICPDVAALCISSICVCQQCVMSQLTVAGCGQY